MFLPPCYLAAAEQALEKTKQQGQLSDCSHVKNADVVQKTMMLT